MTAAIDEAISSHQRGDYAVGAVIARDGKVIASVGESLKSEFDPTGHAEVNAIRLACKQLKAHYLPGCVLYSTHEPCAMCAAASYWAKLDAIVFGIDRAAMIRKREQSDSERFAWRQIVTSCADTLQRCIPASTIRVYSGFMETECRRLLEL